MPVPNQESLALRFLGPTLDLPLSVVAHEREQVAILAKVKGQVISHLHLAINGDRLLLLETTDGNDVRVATQDLSDPVLFFRAPLAQRVRVRLEHLDAQVLLFNDLLV